MACSSTHRIRQTALVCSRHRGRIDSLYRDCVVSMILLWLIVVLVLGGLLAWLAARSHPLLCRWVSLGAISIDLVMALFLAARNFSFDHARMDTWFEQVEWYWIPQFGIHFHLGLDGLSLLLLLLALFLG